MNTHPVSSYHRDFGPELPFSQLFRPFSNREIDGSTARDHGFLPARTLQAGAFFLASRSPQHVGFVHPAQPWPSAKRAGPRRLETRQ